MRLAHSEFVCPKMGTEFIPKREIKNRSAAFGCTFLFRLQQWQRQWLIRLSELTRDQ